MIKFGFKEKNNPCFYKYKTKRNVTKLYMHDNLNVYEKKHNKKSLENTKIETIKQGKQLFFRFLKNNQFYETYLSLLKDGFMNIDFIMKNYFITPFDRIKHKSINEKKIINLSFKWIDFLKSINYI